MTALKRLPISKYAVLCLLFFIGKLAHASVHKSPNDLREYQAFQLPNQMKVLVISDPGADKAAASLDVDVGSNANPQDRAGLAHFLEHMLFLGTEKYPDAGEYQAFISSHGGSHNAYTAFENTNYFFDIKAEDLEPALDRFAQFFISPLFTAKYVDRERHAVHSEYQSKLREDGRRIYSVTKELLNDDHSYSRFSVGSLSTLKNTATDPIREDLIRFYEQCYSANLMSLVVSGPQPLTELKAMVEEKFSAVKDFGARPFRNTAPLYKAGSLPQRVAIKTIKDLRYLSMTFPTPEVRSHWRQKPLYYISSLIGYEGKGSLLSALKEKGWATGLSASTGTDLPNESSFQVNIALTPAGLQQEQQITSLFFQYVDLMKKNGVRKSLYEEEANLAAIQFRFQERSEPMHYVSQLSRQLQLYPINEVVRAPYLFEEFDAALINRFLARITPNNMLLAIKARNVETDRKDPWYQAQYKTSTIASEQLAALNSHTADDSLFIRANNPFIAQDLAIKAVQSPKSHPVVVLEKEGLTVWHHQDGSFKTPKANLYFNVMSAHANDSARNAVLTSLYTRMVKDQLNETLYDAYVAGLSTDIYPHLKGFSVRLSGYNDKLPVLLEHVVKALKDPTFEANRFNVVKQQYEEQLSNAKKDKPFNQAISEIFHLLLPQWSKEQKLAVLESVSFDDLNRFVPQLLSETELRVLAHGNLLQPEARALSAAVSDELLMQAKPELLAATPVVRLQKGQGLTQTLNLPHNDSAISVYFQGSDSGLKTRAEYAVLSELMASPFYSSLRTEKQLGYVVFGTPLQLRKAPGMALVVQSPVADPVTLESHIDSFMKEMNDRMVTMSEEQLEQYKRSVISRVMKNENSLSERSNRYWRQIDRNDADFLSREALAKSIAALSLSDLKDCFTKLDERRLTVRSFGIKHLQNASESEVAKKCDVEINTLKIRGEYMPEA